MNYDIGNVNLLFGVNDIMYVHNPRYERTPTVPLYTRGVIVKSGDSGYQIGTAICIFTGYLKVNLMS